MKSRDLHAVCGLHPVRSGQHCKTVCGKEIQHAHLEINFDGDIAGKTQEELFAGIPCSKCKAVARKHKLEFLYFAGCCEMELVRSE